ncbi:TetR/AcrR family transcriptional regulator [Ketobacter alkanivorans]|uniref:HTH tetR-type domain-containing protein n=1 Tax=Ketobacter alkanivorans TaxID=1917421 RepID=A0A2K9LJH9_9GAMM|nr:TetR/AcrR family transcriptional regulator [Ketobacter alkanivorans]AUM12400.1 hypothetical protein Kalk_08215 [Ketobacter alkanivorans]MCP5019254.1 TetR/AcrR family transcriptional regulator [Ketobacter sp.]
MTSDLDKKTSHRTYGGLSEPERKLERRERFLEAGLEVFGRAGIRGATVRKLCKEAGLTERYFYESFEDSEALFCAVYERQVESLRDFFIAKLPELPTEMDARIRTCLNAYFTFMQDDRVVRVLYVESLHGIERVSTVRQANHDMMSQFAAQWIKSDNPELTVTLEFAAAVAQAINGACYSMSTQWMLGGYKLPIDMLVDSCSLLVLGTMRALKEEFQPS